MKALLLVLWFIAAIALLAPYACAQEPGPDMGGVAVGPTFIEIDIAPGGTWQGEFAVIATGQGRVVIDLELKDLFQKTSGAKIPTDSGAGVRSATGWIETLPEITMSGGERQTVPLVVKCPEGAFGSYSAFVLVKLRPEEPAAAMVTQLIAAINVELLIRVRSSGSLQLDVEGVELHGNARSPTLTIDVRNTGVWVTDVKGDVLLYPEAGGFPERAEIPVRTTGHPMAIYPGQLVRMDCTFARQLPPGAYTALVRLDLGRGRESRAQFLVSLGDRIAGSDRDLRGELGTDLWLEESMFELTLPSGAARSVPVRVRNTGDTSIVLKATVEDVRMESDGAWTFGQSGDSVPGLSVEVSPDSLEVGPKRTALFRAMVKMERVETLESTVVKGVRLVGSADGDPSQEGWETLYDMGALLVIAPPTRGEANVDIVSLKLIRSDPELNPGGAVLTVGNTGGAAGHVKGTIVLKRTTGQAIATMTIGKDNWVPVAPGGKREFRMPLPVVDEGDFIVEAEIVQKDSSVGPRYADALFTSATVTPEGLR